MRARSLLRPSPAYVWRPSQIARRLAFERRGARLVRLPWGDEIEVDPAESIGSGIARLGVHELRVSELVWRLTDPGDLALDVGANIGHHTSLLSRRAARVIALEPHPVLRERLRANARRWRARVEIDPRAASDAAGSARLGEPPGFERNAGTAGLGMGEGPAHEVGTVRLDDLIGPAAVGVCKLDVEGHELAALDGFGRALREGRVRDLVFEEHRQPPTPVTERLADHGYWLFSIWSRLGGIELRPAERLQPGDWDAPALLATRAPGRALRRCRGLGWRCLHPGRRDRGGPHGRRKAT